MKQTIGLIIGFVALSFCLAPLNADDAAGTVEALVVREEIIVVKRPGHIETDKSNRYIIQERTVVVDAAGNELSLADLKYPCTAEIHFQMSAPVVKYFAEKIVFKNISRLNYTTDWSPEQPE